ncbi:uncharacterized protein LOC110063462 [Orbicella faveolata]|uniref:uncharacterized protein LOC110063462 n=1 Tax=Orbicella faveolata TaxID=48498 RepID=UPI0009E2576B|nr:uncharacterized protein LOC110063462 [Orbicella faveolata]
MAAHFGHGRRRGQRNVNVERQMDQNWRTAPRSGSPSSSLVNGSPHLSYKREPTTSADYEYKRNVEFLKREWKKFEAEHRSRKGMIKKSLPWYFKNMFVCFSLKI